MGSPRLTGKLTRACALVVLKARAGVNLSTGAIRRETFAEAEARGISTANLAQICGYLRSMARETSASLTPAARAITSEMVKGTPGEFIMP